MAEHFTTVCGSNFVSICFSYKCSSSRTNSSSNCFANCFTFQFTNCFIISVALKCCTQWKSNCPSKSSAKCHAYYKRSNTGPNCVAIGSTISVPKFGTLFLAFHQTSFFGTLFLAFHQTSFFGTLSLAECASECLAICILLLHYGRCL